MASLLVGYNKTSTAGRSKYDSYLAGNFRDRRL
jgi:hypothetical protein